jgi:riboflavin biosynthesis pyrimidine reductase
MLGVLAEAQGLPELELPAELRERYGGPLGFEEPRLLANFVSSIDGIVSIPTLPRSNVLISGGSETDRFVMGLLRAVAGAVLIGSGTLHGSPNALWTAERIYPAAADAFAELRRRLGLPPAPELVVMTGTGSLNVAHPALEAGAVVITTGAGAASLRGRLPDASTLLELPGGGLVDPTAAVEAVRSRGHSLVLAEAGPHVFGSLLAAGLVDELFLTVSPLVAGRSGVTGRFGLVEGVDLLPTATVNARLLSVRRDDAHLFLRYELRR